MLLENTPLLETQDLILRKFTPEDAPALLTLLQDPVVNTFLPWFLVKTLAEAQNFLQERFLSTYEAPQGYCYAICLKAGSAAHTPIGYVCLSQGESRDFGYALRREFWHKGLTTQAAFAVVERIRAAGLPYITATHDVNNPHSGAVMQKLGMTYRYTYEEQWQPKNTLVTFRMYQLSFEESAETYLKYWNKYSTHFVETL